MKKRKIIAAVTIAVFACVGTAGVLRAQSGMSAADVAVHKELRKPSGKKVTFSVGGKSMVVDLYDNATARDLLTKLPLTIKAANYPGYDEKLLRLKQGLSMQGAPKGDEPEIPEVGYYDPGQWIALYYGPIGYWAGKVPLGSIHAGVDEIRAISEGTSITIDNAR